MIACKVTLEILSYWQPGSGLGIEAAADSAVVRDAAGLPVLPGRTLKGLLRDACDLAGIPEKRLVDWFGSKLETGRSDEPPEPEIEKVRFTTKPGALRFDSARLPQDWIDWVTKAAPGQRDDGAGVEEIRAALFRFVASTAIDERGVARDKTLRVMEVAVPMTLTARVEGPADDRTWIDGLKKAAPLLRALGSRRHRGYGRVACKIEEIR